MTLRQQQSLFVLHIGRLIEFAYSEGYELTFGEAHRPKVTAEHYAELGIGIANSLHISKLALDLNLFKDGRYLSSTESFRPLGEWWEEQHELATWGGWFDDGGHFSFTRGGVR